MSKHKIEKTVYLLRHGQSRGNVAPVFQSTTSPLSDVGVEQAEVIADRVTKVPFEALISSPLQRAKQTAEAIHCSTGKNIEFSELFVERIKPTYMYGKSHADERAARLWRDWEKSLYTPGMRAEDGENYDDLLKRAEDALAFLRERKERSIVVVSHGYFLRTIVAKVLLGESITSDGFRHFQKNASTENTGMTVLRYQSGYQEGLTWRLWTYNDIAHLG